MKPHQVHVTASRAFGLTKIIKDRLVSDISTSNLVVNSNSMVKTIVNHNPQAIGFVSLGSVDRSVKAITIDGIDANAKNIASIAIFVTAIFDCVQKR